MGSPPIRRAMSPPHEIGSSTQRAIVDAPLCAIVILHGDAGLISSNDACALEPPPHLCQFRPRLARRLTFLDS